MVEGEKSSIVHRVVILRPGLLHDEDEVLLLLFGIRHHHPAPVALDLVIPWLGTLDALLREAVSRGGVGH